MPVKGYYMRDVSSILDMQNQTSNTTLDDKSSTATQRAGAVWTTNKRSQEVNN